MTAFSESKHNQMGRGPLVARRVQIEETNLVYYVNDGSAGVRRDTPHYEHFNFLIDAVCVAQYYFLRLIEWCGVRYLLLWNIKDGFAESPERASLQKVFDGIKNGDSRMADTGKLECMRNSLPHLLGYRKRKEEDLFPNCCYFNDGLSCKKTVKLQLRAANGSLEFVKHDMNLDCYEPPFKNPSLDLKLFRKNNITHVSRINRYVSRVEVDGVDYCLKRVRWQGQEVAIEEIKRLLAARGDPNVVELAGLLSTDGLIDGFLTRFVHGKLLGEITAVTSTQRGKWMEQLKDVMRRLHDEIKIIWGDVKPMNILIEDGTDLPKLFDFEGGCTYPWVDPELANTEQGDNQGLSRLLDFISKIPDGG